MMPPKRKEIDKVQKQLGVLVNDSEQTVLEELDGKVRVTIEYHADVANLVLLMMHH